jgi:hypothetical protein
MGQDTHQVRIVKISLYQPPDASGEKRSSDFQVNQTHRSRPTKDLLLSVVLAGLCMVLHFLRNRAHVFSGKQGAIFFVTCGSWTASIKTKPRAGGISKASHGLNAARITAGPGESN